MTMFGQCDYLESFHSKNLKGALKDIWEFTDLQSIERFPIEDFSKMEMFQSSRISMFENMPKSCLVAMKT